ncbi:MAG: GAF domain-containing protein, partial [Chloroflexi bacterium]|nr:GAF domain-containing protein [Chloroflexota bacterium]
MLFEVSVFADTEFSESERLRDAELEWDDKPYIATSTAIRPLRVFGDVAQLPRWTLVVAAPEINVIDQLALLGVLGGAGLALFLGLSIAMVWVGGSMLRNRVQVAADGLEQLRRGDLEAKLPAMGSEFAPLTDGFNAMSDQIRGLVNGLEKRVRNRIRDLELVSEISSEVAGLRDLDLVLNRAINLIVERFGYYHAQVFLLDDIRDFAVLVASTGMPGERLLAKEHKLAVGSDSVIGRVTALGITVIAGDTESSDVPWRPNVELPDTRSEMALPLNVEGEVIGALDIQSLEPDIFTPEEIEIFQVLADQLALAINNARLIQQLQQRMDQVNVLNQRLTEKGWSGFAAESDEAPLAYRYDLMTTEPFEPADEVEGASEDNTGGFATPIEVAGSKIGLIQTTVSDSELAGEERGLVEAVAARVALAIENARLVQETQSALGEAQRLFEMARTVSSAAELDLQGIYQVIIDQLTFELRLDQVAILLAEPIPSYLVNTLKVAYVWHRGRLNGSWHVGQYLDLMQQGLSDVFAAAPAQMLEIDAQSAAANSAYMAVIDALQAHQVEMFPLVTGDRWFGVLVCATNNPQGLGQRFLDFSYAVADQLTVAIDNRRLFGEVQDEARRARALAEASQLVTQMTGDLSAGVERLFRVVSGPGEFDRWWFGLLEPDGVLLRRVAGYTPVTIPLPERVDLSTEQNALTEAIHLRQVVIINDLADTHSVAGVVSPEDQARYGKHMAMPVMLGYEEALGVVLIGRPSDELDFDERDMQLATTLASQLAVATQNQRLFDQIESQRRTLQHTLEAMPAGVLVFSPDGDVTLSNAQVKAMLGAGITQGIFAEDTYPVYVAGTRQPYPPEDFPIYRALNQRQMVSGENFAIERPDGKHIEVLLNAAPIYDEANQLLSVIAVFQEITELRELEQALQESLSETTSLYEASRSLAAASTTPELVDVLVNQLQQLAPDQVYVVLREGVDEGMPENRLAAVWPESLPRPDAVHAIPVPSRMLMVDNALILDDTENMREGGQIAAWGQQAKSNGIYSMASLPMKARGNRTLGWFAVLFEKGHTFAADERRFMTTLASQAAVSLDVIWLFESTQRALRTVANLYRGNKRVAEAQGIEEATTVVREELMRFKPDRIDLLIERNPENPEYAQSLIAWSPERSLEDIPALPLDPATLAPQVSFDIFGPEEYYIQDLSESPDGELHHALRFLDSPYRAVMSIPLRVSGHPIGRLAMGFMEPRRFSSDDRQFATMLADSAAYIVQNELLFLKTQESLEETGMLYQASRSIANAQQREDVVQAMIDHVAAGTVDKVMLINLLSETWEQQG